jgi:hypothetical protein
LTFAAYGFVAFDGFPGFEAVRNMLAGFLMIPSLLQAV